MDQEAGMRHPAAVRIVVAMLCMAVLAGCDDTDEDPMKTQEQFEKLMQRPDLEQAKQRYDKVQQDVRAALRGEFDLPEWENDGHGRVSAGCTAFPDIDSLDVVEYQMDIWVAKGSVVPQWDEVKSRVREIAGEYGFAKVTITTGSGEHRAFELSDEYGATFNLSSKGNTSLNVWTGCHLTPKAKRRGEPVTTEESRRIREEKRESRLNDIDG